jgi:hypothetical protein
LLDYSTKAHGKDDEAKEESMNSSTMEPEPIGIWTAQFDYQPAAKAQEAAAELEDHIQFYVFDVLIPVAETCCGCRSRRAVRCYRRRWPR